MQSITPATSSPVARAMFGRHSGMRRRSKTVAPVVSSPLVSTSPAVISISNNSGWRAATRRNGVVQIDSFDAQGLTMRTEQERQHFAEKTARPARFARQLVEQVVGEENLPGDVQRNQGFGGRRAKTRRAAAGSQKILNSAAGVMSPGPANGPAFDHHLPQHGGQLGIALQGAVDIRQRSQGDERHVLLGCPDLVRKNFFRQVAMLQLGDGKTGVSQAVGAIEFRGMDRQSVVGQRGHAQARPARRVELFDNRLHVARRLVGHHVAAGGGDGDDFPLGLERANVIATASSMPGSTSKMTFLVIIPASQASCFRRRGSGATQCHASARLPAGLARRRGRLGALDCKRGPAARQGYAVGLRIK